MDGSAHPPQDSVARIGPNAILQLVAVLDHCEGAALRHRVMARAGVVLPPPDSGMIPETEAAAVHLALREVLPGRAEGLLRLAGIATADYILAHRIPRLARLLIRALPGVLGARLLTAAIARHAWTFAGSGGFRVAGRHPLTFEVAGNPLTAGLRSDHPMCDWHAAVFERLFARLVWPAVEVEEVACTATGAAACRFVLHRRGRVQAAPRTVREK
jgi:divinyl protochlorophyllide a 8-vinyl-reductase